MKSSSELEGIENGNIQIGDVGGVACHQCHAMDFGGCRQKAVDNRQRAAGVEPPNRVIDRQNVFGQRPYRRLQASSQSRWLETDRPARDEPDPQSQSLGDAWDRGRVVPRKSEHCGPTISDHTRGAESSIAREWQYTSAPRAPAIGWRSTDWIVIRNRLSGSRNNRHIADGLTELGKQMAFRWSEGFAERVVYSEPARFDGAR